MAHSDKLRTRKKKKYPIALDKIHLLNIQVFKSQIDASIDLLNTGEKPAEISSTVANETSYNPSEKLIRIRTNICLNSKDKNGNNLELTGNFGIEYIFKVDNLEDFLLGYKDDMPQYHPNILLEILSITYSTSRGIVLQATEGSFLSGVILPVVDVGVFVG